MTAFILAPTGVKSTGIGIHSIKFDYAGRCPDPGLNAGERAYMRGRGYRFEDSEPEPVAEPAPVAEVAPAEPAPAPKSPRKRPSRAKPKPVEPQSDTAPADA